MYSRFLHLPLWNVDIKACLVINHSILALAI